MREPSPFTLPARIRVQLSEANRNLLMAGLVLGTLVTWIAGTFAFSGTGTGGIAFVFGLMASFATYGLVQRFTHWGPGEVSVEEGALVLRAGRRVRRFPVSWLAWGGRRRDGVDFETVAGHRILLDTQDQERAHRLLLATGSGVDQRRLKMKLRGEVGPFVSGLMFFMLLLVPLSIVFAALLGPYSVLGAPVAAVAGAWGLVKALRSPYVAIGIDGVTIKRDWRRQFIPHDRIQNVTNTGNGLILYFDGQSVELPTIGWTAADVDRVIHRILDARRMAEGGGASPEDFARKDLDASAWVDQLRRVMSADTSFRRRRISVDDAQRTLADPLAPLETRVGAALAMQHADPEQAPTYIRFAAEAAADDATREILLATLEAEAEEAVAKLDARRR